MTSSLQPGFGYLPLTVDRLVLTGADRVKFLHGFCTADIKRMTPGEIREAFILNTKGKLVGHVQVLCGEDSLELVTWPDQAAGLREHLDRYLIREQVEFGLTAAAPALFLFADSGLLPPSLGEMAPGTWRELPLPPGNCLLAVGDFCGPGCLLLSGKSSPAASLEQVAAWLETTCGGGRVDLELLEAHRLANCFPRFGVDADAETLPQELQRDRQAISFDKGCYLGQETVARIDALGHVNRLLVRLSVDAGGLPPLPADLCQGETRVGRLTSVAGRDAKRIGLGLVKRGLARPGTQLQCGGATLVVD